MPEETINLKERQTMVSVERENNLKALLLLALVSFTGIYLYSTFFGAYKDDYTETVNQFPGSTAHFLDMLVWFFKTNLQGRPLSWALNGTLDYLLGHSLNLEYSYLAGWAIFTLNAYLIFNLLKKILNQNAALV